MDVAATGIDLLAGAPARMRSLASGALSMLEWWSLPRRFSRLPHAARVRRIERMERSRLLAVRGAVLLVKTLSCVSYTRDERVGAAVGWEPRCSGPPAPARLDPADLVPPPPGEVVRCDVVVVGSGAGGASAARVLAEAGLDVVVLEEGAYHDARGYSRDPVAALRTLYRDGGLTACDGAPPIPLPVGRCVGGTTVINSGTCVRPPAGVFGRWRDEHGIAWATELDGELEGVERDLDVTPVDPARAGRNAELCRAGAEAIGASNGPLPRMAPGVTCCGSCPMGCALDAKRAMHVSELPRAVAAGGRVVAGARVEKVILEGGRAAGVAAATDQGHFVVASRAVVLAGGALGTPELLLRQGLADGSGHVGRHLRIQPACWVGARHPGEDVRGWNGVMQSWAVNEWLDRGLFLESTFSPLPFGAHWMPGAGEPFRDRLEHYGEMSIVGVHLADRSEGRVRVRGGALRLSYRLTREDAAALRFGIARAAQIHFAAGAAEVYPQVAGLGVLRPGEEDRVQSARGHPADLRLEAFHPMGTARMGSDPRASVVDPDGQSHDVPGLYVADAGVLPTSLGANPMITIMAVARRIARGLAGRLA